MHVFLNMMWLMLVTFMMLDINPESRSHGTKSGFSVLCKGACKNL